MKRLGRSGRDRLVAAAIRVLRRDGPGGLTTVSVTREAGIVQSGFYKHFPDIGECERSAAREVATEFRRMNRDRRERLLAANPTDVGKTAEYYEAWLSTALGRDRRLSELYFQYRRVGSPLGEVAREFERESRADILAWLGGLAPDLGAEHRPLLELQADLLMADALGMCEALLGDRVSDLRAVARLLAENAIAQTIRDFQAMSSKPLRPRAT